MLEWRNCAWHYNNNKAAFTSSKPCDTKHLWTGLSHDHLLQRGLSQDRLLKSRSSQDHHLQSGLSQSHHLQSESCQDCYHQVSGLSSMEWDIPARICLEDYSLGGAVTHLSIWFSVSSCSTFACCILLRAFSSFSAIAIFFFF